MMTGIKLLTRGRTFARSLVKTTRRWVGRRYTIVATITSFVTTRGLAFVIRQSVFLEGWHQNGIGKNLEIFHSVGAKITMNMKMIVPDVILRKVIKELDLALLSSSSFSKQQSKSLTACNGVWKCVRKVQEDMS